MSRRFEDKVVIVSGAGSVGAGWGCGTGVLRRAFNSSRVFSSSSSTRCVATAIS